MDNHCNPIEASDEGGTDEESQDEKSTDDEGETTSPIPLEDAKTEFHKTFARVSSLIFNDVLNDVSSEMKETKELLDKVINVIPSQKCLALTLKNQECKGKIYKNNYCKIHYKLYRLEKPEDCAVCTDSLSNETKPLSCGHWVHRKCVMDWGRDICPICRKTITLSAAEHRHINRKQEKQQIEMIMNFLVTMLFAIEESVQSPEIVHEEGESESDEDENHSFRVYRENGEEEKSEEGESDEEEEENEEENEESNEKKN
jgi:hypothetical protein